MLSSGRRVLGRARSCDTNNEIGESLEDMNHNASSKTFNDSKSMNFFTNDD